MPARTATGNPGAMAWIAAFMVAACAAALSFAALTELARVSGVADTLAPLLPITIDAGVLVAGKFWLSGLGNRVTRFARNVMLTLIVVSSLGNIAGHAFAATPPTRLWLTALVSLVAPLTLAGLAHLIVIARADRIAPVEEVALTTDPIPAPPLKPLLKAPAATPPAQPVGPLGQPAAKETREGADPLLDQLNAWIAETGSVPSKRWVIRELNVGDTRASKLLKAVEPHNNGVKVV